MRESQALPKTAAAAVPERQAERVAVLRKGMDSQALDRMLATPSWNTPEEVQVPAPDGEGAQAAPATRGQAAVEPVPHGETPAALGLKTGGAEATAEPQPAAQASQPAERRPQGPAEAKAPRVTLGFHGTYQAAPAVSQTGGPAQDPAGQDTTSAAPVAAAKSAPLQGGAQHGFADAEHKEHPDQTPNGSAGTPVQPQGGGVSATVAAEATQSEPKPAHGKSALHESILSQIRDGVVTHDGKGNGQMSIRLNPEDLGELRIQVRMDDNRLRVEVQADNGMVKDLLMSNLDSLKESLASKNFSMTGFDVSTGGGSFGSLPEQQGSPRQQAPRSARPAGYADQGEQEKVNYVTAEVNNLLDVRF